MAQHWGSTRVVSRGVLYHLEELQGWVALLKNEPVGFLLYKLFPDELEVVALWVLRSRIGVGKALMLKARNHTQALKLSRVVLVTTNDNVPAQAFYRAMGLTRVTIRKNTVRQARILKPEIPLCDEDGVPIRDEWEYEWKA